MLSSRGSRDSTAFAFLLFGSVVLLVSANQRWMASSSSSFLKRARISPDTTSSKRQTAGELIVYDQNHHEVWRRKTSRDGDDSEECEVEVVNELSYPVLFCWVDHTGQLKGFRPINDRSIKDNSVSNNHVEYAYAEHAFLCLRPSSASSCLPKTLREVTNDQFLFHFTPFQTNSRHTITLTTKTVPSARGLRSFLRGNKKLPGVQVTLSTALKTSDDLEVVDSTNKHYDSLYLEGFLIKYEPGVFQEVKTLDQCLAEDLKVLVRLLPAQACAKLQRDTTIWVNKSITFGKKSNPIVATSCTFHPMGGGNWLKNNGLSIEKEGCVEISCAEEYLKSRNHWGTGGILVHEFSHAFHNKCCDKGFECDAILEAYEVAMQKKLYHAVKVHGPQGEQGLAKAYACTNCMEFFAELSVAYHWTEDETEYNKWYPHNRKQLLEYDPVSFAVLDKCWLQYEATPSSSSL